MAHTREQYDEAVYSGILLFTKNGYKNVSIDEIIYATGLNRYSIYSAFGGKQEFFISCIKSYCDSAIVNLSDIILDETLTPGEAVRRNLYVASEEMWKNRAGCLICVTLGDIRSNVPELFEQCLEYFDEVQDMIRVLFERARQQNSLSAHISPEDAAAAYMIFKFGLTNEVKRSHTLDQVKSAIDSFVFSLIPLAH